MKEMAELECKSRRISTTINSQTRSKLVIGWNNLHFVRHQIIAYESTLSQLLFDYILTKLYNYPLQRYDFMPSTLIYEEIE
jgi:hypothetical protein